MHNAIDPSRFSRSSRAIDAIDATDPIDAIDAMDVIPRQTQRPGFTVWLTGLPCSGKSTLASMLQKDLCGLGFAAEILDGDEVRQHLTRGLGYSGEENIL